MSTINRIAAIVLASAATLFAADQAAAATLGVMVHDYGSDPGFMDPSGNDLLGPDSVEINDQSTIRFSDAFDLSAYAGATITGYDFTLTFEGAGPRGAFGLSENWAVRILGSNNSSVFDDMYVLLDDAASPQTISINAGTDFFLQNVFSNSVASGSLEFWFAENSFFSDSFTLYSTSLTVYGDLAAIPLPASMPLMLVGLAGLGIARTRRNFA